MTINSRIDLTPSGGIEYPCLRRGVKTGNVYLYTKEDNNPIVVAIGHAPALGTYVGKEADVSIAATDPFFGSVTLHN